MSRILVALAVAIGAIAFLAKVAPRDPGPLPQSPGARTDPESSDRARAPQDGVAAPPAPVPAAGDPAAAAAGERPASGLRDRVVAALERMAAIHAPGANRAAATTSYRAAFDETIELGRRDSGELRRLSREDPDPGVRSLSIAVLARLGDAEGLAAAARSEREGAVLQAAVEGLGEVGGQVARSAVLEVFRKRPEWSHRHLAARLLGRLGAVEAVDDLAEAVRGDANPSVRLASLEALAALDATRAREAAAGAVTDPNPRVRERALALFESSNR